MAMLVEPIAKLGCGGWWRYLAVPFAPLAGLVIPPFLFFWVVIMCILYFTKSSVLNTVDGEKSWERSFEVAIAIQYCIGLLIAVLVIGRGCNVVNQLPPVVPP